MYDMYPWDARADGPRSRPPRTGTGTRVDTGADIGTGAGTGPDLATQAVQFALDRRDNGGDSTDHDVDSPDAADAAAGHGRQ